jgi:hypothetical protein
LGPSEFVGVVREVTVKLPRFRIAWLMVAVAVSALDLTAIRALLKLPPATGEELILGALPMTNVLALGLITGRWHPASRQFLVGFELFGAIALASYVMVTCLSPGPNNIIHSYVNIFINPIEAMSHGQRNLITTATIVSVVVIVLSAPQVIFAVLGGFFFSGYRITITRRATPSPPQE